MDRDAFEVLIVGGGMVGASMALALSPLGLRVGLVDAQVFGHKPVQPAYDDRSVALAYGSALIYQGMGLWETLAPQAEAIRQIHISDRGHFGATRLSAQREQVPALGYVVESRVLGTLLYQALQASDVELIAPARVAKVVQKAQQVEVQLQPQKTELDPAPNTDTETAGPARRGGVLTTRLLIAADGTHSPVRQQLGIATRTRDYNQCAVIANVSTAKPHHNLAYERFTPNGPLALLPLSRDRYSLVWMQHSADRDAVLAWDDEQFLAQLQQVFGFRQGQFTKAGQRSAYPLQLVKTQKEYAGRVVLIGNASHTLHPVAGQGLNLALRDVAVLADLLAAAQQQGGDVGAAGLLAEYSRLRQPDYKTVVNYTDTLVRVFSNDFAPLGHARGLGLLAVDRVWPLRRLLAQQSMGLRFRQSRLARGLPLS